MSDPKTKAPTKSVPYKHMSPADQAELDKLARYLEPPPEPNKK